MTRGTGGRGSNPGIREYHGGETPAFARAIRERASYDVQEMTMTMKAASRAVTALIVALVVAGCDSPTEAEVHADGVAILGPSGLEVARFTLSAGATGRLTVGVGQTVTFEVRGIDDEGDLFVIDGSEYSIRNPGLVIAHLAPLSLGGVDELVLQGVQAGQTSLHLDLYHGTHQEFLASGIAVRIE